LISPGVKVTIAGSVVNFSLGIFYAWSVFADGLIKELGWSKSAAMFPYTLELLVFSIAMIIGGRFQDYFGPRRGIMLSGIFTGLALILCGLTASPVGIAISFGLIFGSAAAFGYSAVTPAAIKWFPPEKRGLVTGVVLMSLGAAALIWSPLVNFVTEIAGVLNAFLFCGLFLLVVITLCSRFIAIPGRNPNHDYRVDPGCGSAELGNWRENIRQPSFRLLWLMVGLTSGVGLMFVGHLVQIAQLNYQINWGYLLVSLFAGLNAAGRLVGGVLCDRIGYINNLKTGVGLMGVAMLLFLSGLGWPALVAATVVLGLSYGSLYTTYPAIVARLFGLDNFGVNYGIIFTAVGLVGGLGPLAAAYLADLTNSYNPTFVLGLAASIICFLLVFELHKKAARVS